jgi:3-deoxy-D-manno-octulosonate 8-phosphate phosphatase (KDO 8-P phosphatase)
VTELTNDLRDKFQQVKLLLLDVDGVLTDGKLYFGNDGNELKAFNTLDGHGIKLLQKSGVKVGIITGRKSQLVQKRASDLGIEILVQGREDKLVALKEILDDHPFSMSEIAFIGDDYPDLTVMTKVGIGITVANAIPTMLEHSDWKTNRKGGEGAVREICDLIMTIQGTFEDALAPYIS